jgi:hypothetical protein
MVLVSNPSAENLMLSNFDLLSHDSSAESLMITGDQAG